eukprot:symbB.v1.2.003902.t1/scaffold199.1/size273374/7
MKAMSFRHGVAYVDENSRDGAPVHGPWSQQRFCLPPPGRTQDQWVYLEDEGNQYWIKVHHSLRTKKFHPVHRGQPMDVDLLEPMRMTVMFPGGGGPPRRCLDKWTTPDEGKPDRWTGFTFFKMKAKYQSGEDACAGPWSGEPTQGGPAVTEKMTGGDFPTTKSTGKEGSVARGAETPSVVVYVNNYTGSSGSMTVEEQSGYQVHEESASGKAFGKAQRRGRAAVGQTSAGGSMHAAGSSLRRPSSEDWSFISDAEKN